MSNLCKCGECGYDLRGHANAGRCPECATAFDPANQPAPWTPSRTAAIVYLVLVVVGLAVLNIVVAAGLGAIYPHEWPELFYALWTAMAVLCSLAMIICMFMDRPRAMVVLAMGLGAGFSIVAVILNYILLVLISMSI